MPHVALVDLDQPDALQHESKIDRIYIAASWEIVRTAFLAPTGQQTLNVRMPRGDRRATFVNGAVGHVVAIGARSMFEGC